MSNFIRHLSIRVPWHDTAWNGKTCKNPDKNIYCNILKNIGEKRRNCLECKELDINDESTYPPCIKENVSILKSIDIPITMKYQYRSNDNIGKHFKKETKINFEKYSSSVIPFRWMMRNETGQYNFNDIKGLDHSKENKLEKKAGYLNTSWWQCKDNQKILMDTFYNYIAAESSLCFFYSKNAPFIEDTKGRRIIIGIGKITGLGDIIEYDYEPSDDDIDSNGLNRALIWNRTVYHSIREDNNDGFIFPYHELLDYSNKNKGESIDFEKCTLFSDAEMFENFSYVSEHVYNDQVLDLLYKAINVLDEIEKVLVKDYSKQKKWIEKQIKNVWKIRGIYPSFGEVLKSLDIENAYEIERKIYDESKNDESIDYWDYFEKHINNFSIEESRIKKIKKMSEDNKNFYYLISRMSLSEECINSLKNISDDEKKDIINNPYILCTDINYKKKYKINVFTIDKAIFIDDNLKNIDKNYGIVFEDYDDRNNYMRVTAFIVYIMYEQLYNFGHTVLPLEMVLKEVNNISMENKINIDTDDINVIKDEDYFKENILIIESIDDNGKKKISLQLKYYNTIKNIIEETIIKRINKKNKVNEKNISNELKKYISDDKHKLSNNQKEAIKNLALNKFSVLTGSAGTGKTHVIKALCSLSEINKESIMILTPTGKARTLLQNVDNAQTMTIAGFLSKYKRYDFNDAYFSIKEKYESKTSYKTVIIDETSMVSETMLAAIFEVVGSNAERIILVGDHCQLPPIEEGKPFYDIIKYLEENKLNNNLLILKENYRQKKGSESIEYALKFREESEEEIIYSSNKENDIEFIEWNDEEELEEKILEVLNKISINDHNSLLSSFGALENGSYVTFQNAQITHNSWQILTPFRERNYVGCKPINSVIHNKFFADELNYNYKYEFGIRVNALPTPKGEEQILYGDKVINLKNQYRDTFGYNSENKFIANGDIGIITGMLTKKEDIKKAKKDEEIKEKVIKQDFFVINFESANGYFRFGLTSKDKGKIKKLYEHDFPKDENSIVELAYALTVHKAQGSGFGTTIVIIPNISSNLVSREMIYTALTRHKDKVYVLHQNLKSELNKYQEDRYSMIIRRMNNLFADNPLFEYYEKYNSYFDKNKIHITSNGEFVRSKSEVIIADSLYKNGISYEYEKELKLGDRIFIPDFTIEKDDKVYIWEHLGMMDNKEYKAKWEDKKSVYYSNGIKDANTLEDAPYYLITTEESSTSGINSKAINDMIKKYF
ncbi:AAA family ATPase [Brachyspira pilosicoli]|uniref:AAA family ATPase n=1 Tax=Brachyspira pilosicoli TaxID=52584 RepID=UPI0030055E19